MSPPAAGMGQRALEKGEIAWDRAPASRSSQAAMVRSWDCPSKPLPIRSQRAAVNQVQGFSHSAEPSVEKKMTMRPADQIVHRHEADAAVLDARSGCPRCRRGCRPSGTDGRRERWSAGLSSPRAFSTWSSDLIAAAVGQRLAIARIKAREAPLSVALDTSASLLAPTRQGLLARDRHRESRRPALGHRLAVEDQHAAVHLRPDRRAGRSRA